MKTVLLTRLQHRHIEEQSSTKLQAFQRKLYLKATKNPDYKFYCLYDKVFRRDILEEAYKRTKKNRGAPGIDNVTWESLEGNAEIFTTNIQQILKDKTYRPSPLRQVEIPKRSGKTRILRIPTIEDRVVQMAVKLIIEPIFEADFQECSYGYRPKKNAHQAVAKLSETLYRDVHKPEEQRQQVRSIDLSNCFDTIPHAQLMNLIAKRIIDRQLLKLIKSFLKAGALREHHSDEHRGTPQGGVLSPLLANIYLNQIDTKWQKQQKRSPLLRYADDIIVILHPQDEQAYQSLLRYIEDDLKLSINHEKTTMRTVTSGISFLGFLLRQRTSKKRTQYLSIEPHPDAMRRIKGKIRGIVRVRTLRSTEEIISQVNMMVRGWQQYFDNIAMANARTRLRRFLELRVIKLISRRKKCKWMRFDLFRNKELHMEYGLYEIISLGRCFTR